MLSMPNLNGYGRSSQVQPQSAQGDAVDGRQQQPQPQGDDPWAGIDPRLAQLYQQHGITKPGAAGSGFTDAGYWNNTLGGGAGGDWNYLSNRLGSDLSGNGPDQPGPSDPGYQAGGGGAGGGMGVGR